jgi:IS5 family transposase
MGRNEGRERSPLQGDAANVVLTAVGHNLRLVLAWLRALLRLIVLTLLQAFATPSALKLTITT